MTATQKVRLFSASRSDDAGHLAARDLAVIARTLDVDYRLVGGLAVTLLTWVYGVSKQVPARETADADFGAQPQVVADERLLPALTASGYEQIEGNRLTRTERRQSEDIDLTIDLLTPSYKGRLVSNVPVGDFVVDEVPALSLALAMDAVTVQAVVTLTDGEAIDIEYRLPSVVAALCMKIHAYGERRQGRDALDVWRLLETAYSAGVRSAGWNPRGGGVRLDASRLVYQHFIDVSAPGPRAATQDTQQQARIRTLARAVVSEPPADDA